MLFTYRFNLKELGYQEDQYKEVSSKALSLSRGASAVDTGLFRKGWHTSLNGDILSVSNPVRYAAFVELGSVVHKKHKHRIKKALAKLGLTKGSAAFGSKTLGSFGKATKVEGTASTVIISTPETTQKIKPLSEQEIRSPALLLNRFRTARAKPPTLNPIARISNSELFNRDSLLKIIIAAEIARQTLNNNEEE